MAKKLTKEQQYRASICFECGCIPSKHAWAKMQQEKGDDYDAVMYMANQFPISEQEVITIEDLQTKEELHAVADNYNWDDSSDALYAFIDHPLCDAGTALLLFWKGAGYQELSEKSTYATEQKIIFFKELIRRFDNKEFNSYQIAYDPYDECYVPSLDECINNGYFIPGTFFCPYSKMYIDTELS